MADLSHVFLLCYLGEESWPPDTHVLVQQVTCACRLVFGHGGCFGSCGGIVHGRPQLKLWAIIFIAAAHKAFLLSLYAYHIPALYHFFRCSSILLSNHNMHVCVQQLLKLKQLPCQLCSVFGHEV